jgi:ubiquinone/menaquinone biosynthesis C-methylase UbiE
MAHVEQREFFASMVTKFPASFNGVRVLEVGSLNINGTVRDFFTNCKYVGVDVAPGSGVDVVCQGQNLDYPDKTFDTVISAECLEHNPYWADTFANMARMCNGMVFMSCATTGRAEHGTERTTPNCSPLTVSLGWDYYRNLTAQDFTTELDLDSMFSEWNLSTNDSSHDLYFFGSVK